MSRRDDDDRPGHHPSLSVTPPKDLTLTEVREKFEALETSNDSRGRQLTIQSWLIAALVIMAIVGWFTPRPAPPTKSAVDQQTLTAINDSLKAHGASIAYLRAHTDTTGLADVRQEMAAMKANDEQRSADMIQMTDAFNFAGLHLPAKK